MDKNTAVIVAVLATFFACAWLFKQKPSEVGRYVMGKTNLSVLDTKEGRLFVVEDICADHVSVLEIDAGGIATRWKHTLLNLGGDDKK